MFVDLSSAYQTQSLRQSTFHSNSYPNLSEEFKSLVSVSEFAYTVEKIAQSTLPDQTLDDYLRLSISETTRQRNYKFVFIKLEKLESFKQYQIINQIFFFALKGFIIELHQHLDQLTKIIEYLGFSSNLKKQFYLIYNSVLFLRNKIGNLFREAEILQESEKITPKRKREDGPFIQMKKQVVVKQISLTKPLLNNIPLMKNHFALISSWQLFPLFDSFFLELQKLNKEVLKLKFVREDFLNLQQKITFISVRISQLNEMDLCYKIFKKYFLLTLKLFKIVAPFVENLQLGHLDRFLLKKVEIKNSVLKDLFKFFFTNACLNPRGLLIFLKKMHQDTEIEAEYNKIFV